MFSLELSHCFDLHEWRSQATRELGFDAVQALLARDSYFTLRCSLIGCTNEGRAVEMRNLDRAKTNGEVVILCQHHAHELESASHRTFWLDDTLRHAVDGYELACQAAIRRAAMARPRTALGLALVAACRRAA